jgi:hypothetical protein
MLYLSLTISLFALAFLVDRAIRSGPDFTRGEIAVVGVVLAFVTSVPCVVMLYGTLPTMLIATIAMLIWKTRAWPKWSLVPLCLVSLVLGHAVPYVRHVAPSMRDYETIRRTLAEHPAAGRLDRDTIPAVVAQPRYDELTQQDLLVDEVRRVGVRLRRFEELHGDHVRLFVNNPGFGIMRMQPTPHTLEYYMPKREPIPQPLRIVSSQTRPKVEHPQRTPPINLSKKHEQSVVEFAFPVGWGWERTPNKYLGFLPHQFGTHHELEYSLKYSLKSTWKFQTERGWEIRSVELIGLLLDAKPRVYMTEFLPRMDDAKHAPTRELDEFESAGLRALANGDELYYGLARTEPLLRMVGGLRASKSCVSCHAVREGELLGAFSYLLTR